MKSAIEDFAAIALQLKRIEQEKADIRGPAPEVKPEGPVYDFTLPIDDIYCC